MSRSSGLDGEDRVIVVGGGIAGLATALSLAPVPVTVVTQAGLGMEASTCWAQGGIAAALGPRAHRSCLPETETGDSPVRRVPQVQTRTSRSDA